MASDVAAGVHLLLVYRTILSIPSNCSSTSPSCTGISLTDMIPRLASRLSSVQTRRILPHRVAQPHAWTTHLPLIPRPRLIAFYSSLETSRPEAQHLRQEIDDFFAGYGSETPNPLPPPPALPHTASPSPFATDFHPWLRPSDRIAEDVDVDVNEPPVPLEPPPFVSSIRIVQRLLEEHEFLNSQQIWGIATDGCKPILRAAHVIQPDGRIKMKKVATMREERRAWIPPATAPLPDHPFQSMK